jgi:L-alanine-DL-glutamate epimerase-like enolase superfamily enzyme
MPARIEQVSVRYLAAPLQHVYWMSLEPYRVTDEILVEITTDDGQVGIGQAHGRPAREIMRIITDAFTPMLIGENPLDHQRLWQRMFATTHTRQEGIFAPVGAPHFGSGLRAQVMSAIAGIDIALWDLKGKLLGQPVHRLLGGLRASVPCYASGGYYTDAGVDGLLHEVSSYVDQGYPAVKIKVGGASISEDVARIRAIRDHVSADIDLMLDANSAYDIDTAIAAERAFAPYDIRWFEEPLHWYDSVRGLGVVSSAISIPTASGESEMHRWACRDLVELGGVRIMQFDATRAGGVTEWLRVAAHAAAHGVGMAPHHDPQVHGHLVAAAPNGVIVETFPNPERDPLWAELYIDKPVIRDGVMTLNERPGFGIQLDPDALARYTTDPP